MATFDWYHGTIERPYSEVISSLGQSLDTLHDLRPDPPKFGYEQGHAFFNGDERVAAIWWGGNPHTFVQSTGHHAQICAPLFQKMDILPSRIDAAMDFCEMEIIEPLFLAAANFAREHGMTTNQHGDWVNRKKGRTFQLGSRQSTAMYRIYEKGKQMSADPAWLRIESEIHPRKRPQREMARALTPDQVFACQPWQTEFLEFIGFQKFKPQSLGNIWRPSDTDRARAALVKQYGRILQDWSDEVGKNQLADAIFALRNHYSGGNIGVPPDDLTKA